MFRKMMVLVGMVWGIVAFAETIIPGGDVSGLWDILGTPYIIQGNITIQSGDTLIVDPGVEIRFDENVGISVNGSLFADGTTQPGIGDTIYFTSNLPDPQIGDWQGFILDYDTNCDFVFCALEFGSEFNEGNILTFTDCRFSFPTVQDLEEFALNRCLVTIDLFIDFAAELDFEECLFQGDLHVSSACYHATINSSTMEQNLIFNPGDIHTDLELNNCELYGDFDCTPSNDVEVNIISSILHGSILMIGDMFIDNSTVHGAIYANSIYDNQYLSITNSSTIYGEIISRCGTTLSIAESKIENNIILQGAWRTTIHGSVINGSISGSLGGNCEGFDVAENTFLNGGRIDVAFAIIQFFGTISNNLISNTAGDAIRVIVDLEGDYMSINNNTIYNVEGTGISFRSLWFQPYQAVPIIYNNIISTCTEYGVYLSNTDTAFVSYNDVWNCTGGNYFGVRPGAGSISQDPLFVDPEDDDYHLQSVIGSYHGGGWLPDPNHSPCIDAGDPSSPFSNEQPDPNGNRINMGAYGNTVEASNSWMPLYDFTVQLNYNSGSPVPAGGGYLNFDVFLQNDEIISVNFDLWIEIPPVIIPPLLPNRNLTFPGGFFITRPDMNWPVPAGWPAGNYNMVWNIGDISTWTVWASDSFPFEKSADNDGSGFTLWEVEGDPLEQLFDSIDIGEAATSEFALLGVYPNPFNPSTTIRFDLPEACVVKLEVFDIKGREVSVGAKHVSPLQDAWYQAGTHEITFDGMGLSSGIYFYRIEAGEYIASGKMVLMK